MNYYSALGLDSAKIIISIYHTYVSLMLLLIVLLCLLIFKKCFSIKVNTSAYESINIIKVITVSAILFQYFLIMQNLYIFYKTNGNFMQGAAQFHSFNYNFDGSYVYYFYPQFTINFSIDFFSLVVLFIAYSVGFICLIALGSKYHNDNENTLMYFILFLIIVTTLATTSNYILWVLMYECLLIPSFFIVYRASSSRRSIQAALYFVIYTQIGSFIVVCVVGYLVVTSGTTDFIKLSQFKFTSTEVLFIYTFLFIGFGIKIPIWPFHFWLTKTHVEASAGFSMYLSGFLVKTAALGFYKFSISLGSGVDTSIFVAICMVGVVDASLKLFGQTDIKKLVAYCTILEMNLIMLGLCWGSSTIFLGSVYFVYTHAFLSSLMFFIVDCVQKRYGTRSVVALSGILHVTPNLGITIFIMCIIFSGIPGTMKFVSEFIIFSTLYQQSPVLCIFIIFVTNFLAVIGFSKCWFNILFGMSSKYANANIMDLTSAELLIISLCFFFLVCTPFIHIFY